MGWAHAGCCPERPTWAPDPSARCVPQTERGSPVRGTYTGCGKRKLRVDYQAVEPQAVEPPMAAARINASTNLRMKQLLSRGTNGNMRYTPFGGWNQAFATIRAGLPPLLTPIAAWACSLALLAFCVAGALVMRGWTLGNPFVILGLAAVAAVAERGRVRLNPYLEERSEERRVGKECPVLCRSRWSPYH